MTDSPATGSSIVACARPATPSVLALNCYDPPSPEPPRRPSSPAGALQERLLGRVEVARYCGGGSWRFDRPGQCRLVLQCAGRSVIGAGSSPPLALSAAEWIVLSEPSLELRGRLGSEAVTIGIPRHSLSRALLRQVQETRPAVRALGGAARLCLELARLGLTGGESQSDAARAALGDALADFVKLALIEQATPGRPETIRETVRSRIVAHVNRNLADPELTIDRIAEHLHCTKRYLHKVFSEDGETLSQYIWSRRLELCRAELARPELAGRSITEIAFACGFSNAAHFSRSFKARFGQSPRAFRQAETGALRANARR